MKNLSNSSRAKIAISIQEVQEFYKIVILGLLYQL
jgi:hypothetical protein